MINFAKYAAVKLSKDLKKEIEILDLNSSFLTDWV